MLEHAMVEVFYQSINMPMRKEFLMKHVITTRLKIKTVILLINVEHVRRLDSAML